ncbi:MAG: bifunctional folylpolyglutamate synthase/dihydrofolate synthase [Hungatella sp.]|jgi:dihydrofolate synthase/folylpolyglutamate synthase|nr:bifunctional folylpolyglutamate synthase/dihydrofolate synthase [Hungatella sp.]
MIQAERYLEEIPMWAAKKNSLEAIRDFLGRMGHPDRETKIVHVAGTNGKGSVCTFLASILRQAGYDTAVFISPHLINVRERFLHNGSPVGETDFLDAFETVKGLSQAMAADGYAWPTYFEFLFYMFLEMARGWKPDAVILETGLGGLLDTTNVVEHPLISVITSVSMDHMQYLGSTIQEIAASKAGILKYKTPVVYDGNCAESRQVIENTGQRLCCAMYPVEDKDIQVVSRDGAGMDVVMNMEGGSLKIQVPSQADYQAINAGVAVRAAQVINGMGGFRISKKAMEEGIRTSFWPGRMEEVLPGVFLDGAHNTGGMEALTRTIVRMQGIKGRPVFLMFGVAEDKEYHQMIEELCSRVAVSRVIVAHMDTERSAKAGVVAGEFEKRLSCPVKAFDTVAEAWDCLIQTKGEDLAFCAGSLYLVGEVKALLEERSGTHGRLADWQISGLVD